MNRRVSWLSWLIALAGVLSAGPALAHKASDSYLQFDSSGQGTTLRWDIALRDLDAAIGLDADDNGQLTWGEVKAAWPKVQSYALAHLKIDGCALQPASAGERSLERRNDGTYAVLRLTSACQLASVPVIAYTLFADVDPTHRGIAKWQHPGQPIALMVLDPTRPPAVARDGRGAASAPGASSSEGPVHGDLNDITSGWGFLREGVRHILTGYDHVLFLLCLLLPSVMRRGPDGWRPVDKLSQAVLPVVGIVSAFTIAHSITLGLAAMKVISLPPSFIEPAIAVTIVLAALDNVWPIFPVRRVVVTFLFGLIHGFGFAGVLGELNLPTAEFVWALLEFNIGLELGQLLIVVGVTAVLFALRQRSHYRSWVIRGGSFAAIVVGVLWFIERTANVSLLPI